LLKIRELKMRNKRYILLESALKKVLDSKKEELDKNKKIFKSTLAFHKDNKDIKLFVNSEKTSHEIRLKGLARNYTSISFILNGKEVLFYENRNQCCIL
jgi:hypothetical protein